MVIIRVKVILMIIIRVIVMYINVLVRVIVMAIMKMKVMYINEDEGDNEDEGNN